MANKRNILGVNPAKATITDEDLGKLSTLAPQYYQYLMNPDTYDYNNLPTGQAWAQLGKYSGYNIDYDSLRTQLKATADAKAAQQAAVDKQNADALATQAATVSKRQTDINNATGIAQRNADDLVKQWGLDPSQYDSRISSGINDLVAGLGDSKDPYSTLDGAQVATKLLNADQTAQRNANTAQANSTFGANYGNNLIGSHLLDGAISGILGQQSGAAQSYLDRGKARGIYNDTGYNAGEAALNNQLSAAQSKVGTLADDVLQGYRTQANTVRDNAYSAASNATLGQNFNLGDYVNQGNDILSTATSRGAGDLSSAVGGTNYFDLSSLNNAAGAAQGVTNYRDSSIAGALAERNKQKVAARGLGSQGVF